LKIIEVGPRDGLQNEQRILSSEEKITYIELLVDAGISRLEAVSFARPDRVPQMADAEAVMAGVPRRDSVSYIGLVMNERGLDRAIASGVDEANLVVVATETFCQRNQGMSVREALRGTEKMVERATAGGLSVSVTIGAAFGCPFEGEVSTQQVMDIVTVVDQLGVDEIALADTIGVGTPVDVRRLVGAAKQITQKPLRLHLHNTRNTGYANAFAALEAGVSSLDASSGGIGGCPFAPSATGNIATEDLTYLLERSGVSVGLDFDRLLAASDFVTAKLGIATPALLGRAGWFPAPDYPDALTRD
jgi:hydroxymethylglutaryl-CoA lyase